MVRNYVLQQVPFTSSGCVVKGNANGALNHFEIRINQSRIEVWGSDAGSTAVRLIASADNANITMTRGVIWVQDMHYNASKAGCCGGVDGRQTTHTFAWDNIAFDGPKPYRDLTFDVPEAQVPSDGGINTGWAVSPSSPLTLTVPGVTWAQTPTTALVTFSFFCEATVVPSVSVNGQPAHATAWPYPGGTDYTWRTIAVPVPLSEVHAGHQHRDLHGQRQRRDRQRQHRPDRGGAGPLAGPRRDFTLRTPRFTVSGPGSIDASAVLLTATRSCSSTRGSDLPCADHSRTQDRRARVEG